MCAFCHIDLSGQSTPTATVSLTISRVTRLDLEVILGRIWVILALFPVSFASEMARFGVGVGVNGAEMSSKEAMSVLFHAKLTLKLVKYKKLSEYPVNAPGHRTRPGLPRLPATDSDVSTDIATDSDGIAAH